MFLVIVVLWLGAGSPVSAVTQLSDQAELSVLTCSPGEELYSVFGHTALWVHDPVNGIDRVYNYGTFNFNVPNFYLKFAQGKLLYSLSVSNYRQFEYTYQYENRSVIAQILDLSPEAKQHFFELLEENYLPQNRDYKYDFFFDNCTTRIEDILRKALKAQQISTRSYEDSAATFRDLIDLYLVEHHWSDFGIDLGLGLPTDQLGWKKGYNFLPDLLMEFLDNSTVVRDGATVPLVKEKRVLLRANPPAEEGSNLPNPKLLLWGLFVIALALTAFKPRKLPGRQVFDGVFFIVIGIAGMVIFLLWFATDHLATKGNLNLLWAIPLHLVAGIMLIRKQQPDWLIKYLAGAGALCLVLLLTWPFFPQAYNTTIIPILLLIVLRTSDLFMRHRRQRSGGGQ